jgi:hypothetical protein
MVIIFLLHCALIEFQLHKQGLSNGCAGIVDNADLFTVARFDSPPAQSWTPVG